MDWAELDGDLLVEIARRIRVWEDFLSFRGVCKSWKYVAVEQNFRHKSLQVPWLMLPPNRCSDRRDLFSLSKNVIRQIILPEANAKKCFSSKGWIITIGQDWSMSLLHPFSQPHIQIKLPHIKTIKNWYEVCTSKMYINFIDKCVLSSNPLLTRDYILLVFYGGTRGKLAYFRPGDKFWNILDPDSYSFSDAVYHNGRFYALNRLGQLKAYEISSDNTITAEKVTEFPLGVFRKSYVVESGGALLLVRRKGWEAHRTSGFLVFEVHISTGRLRKVKNLGNRALFLGHNSSLSVEACEASGCNPNCIYFTDDFVDGYWFERKAGGKDMGVYNMEDGSIKPFFMGNSYSRMNPAMWLEQSFIL